MVHPQICIQRRTFNALAAGVASLAVSPAQGAWAGEAFDKRAQFVRDLSAGVQQQLVGVDLADIDLIFQGVRNPVLGMGIANGATRAADAASSALRDAGRVGDHAIVTIVFPPAHWRLREFKQALDTARMQLDAGAGFQIYVLCVDDQIENGASRVSVLTG